MPFNGSGVFQSLPTPTFPALAGQVIYADRFNSNLNDIFTGLTNCITRDGQSPASANLPMGGYKLTNLGAATGAGQAVVFGQTGTLEFKNILLTPTSGDALAVQTPNTVDAALTLSQASQNVTALRSVAGGFVINVDSTTGTTERLRITNGGIVTVGGNFGVGTTNPLAKLNVEGSVLFRGGNIDIGPTAGANGAARISTLLNAGVEGTLILSTANSSAVLTERVRIDALGNVLLSDTAPSSPVANYRTLQVSGGTGGIVDVGSTGIARARVSGDVNGANFEALGVNPIVFRTNSTERVRIDASGNVGIGITPAGKLNVAGEVRVSSDGGFFALFNSASSSRIAFWQGNPGSSVILMNEQATPFILGTSGNERFRVDAAGNFGLGTTTTGSWRASVAFDGTAVNGVTIEDTNAGGSPTLFRVRKNGVDRFAIQSSGAASLPGALTVGSVAGDGSGLSSLNASNLASGIVPAARITSISSGATVDGVEIGYKSIPNVATTGTTAATTERGKMYVTTGGITVPNATFSAGDTFSIYNNSGAAVTITQGTSLTLRQAGTTNTGNRTLAPRGICTVTFVSGSEAIISGAGLS